MRHGPQLLVVNAGRIRLRPGSTSTRVVSTSRHSSPPSPPRDIHHIGGVRALLTHGSHLSLRSSRVRSTAARQPYGAWRVWRSPMREGGWLRRWLAARSVASEPSPRGGEGVGGPHARRNRLPFVTYGCCRWRPICSDSPGVPGSPVRGCIAERAPAAANRIHPVEAARHSGPYRPGWRRPFLQRDIARDRTDGGSILG